MANGGQKTEDLFAQNNTPRVGAQPSFVKRGNVAFFPHQKKKEKRKIGRASGRERV